MQYTKWAHISKERTPLKVGKTPVGMGWPTIAALKLSSLVGLVHGSEIAKMQKYSNSNALAANGEHLLLPGPIAPSPFQSFDAHTFNSASAAWSPPCILLDN